MAIPAKYTRAREKGLPPLLAVRLLAGAHFRARACMSAESPKLETTCSLMKIEIELLCLGKNR